MGDFTEKTNVLDDVKTKHPIHAMGIAPAPRNGFLLRRRRRRRPREGEDSRRSGKQYNLLNFGGVFAGRKTTTRNRLRRRFALMCEIKGPPYPKNPRE